MTDVHSTVFVTPYESGNGNQTTTYAQCVSFYQALAAAFPTVLRFTQIGISDNGSPMFGGVVTADGQLDREQLLAAQRPVFFNNNGIHPGEPEGIDVCMGLVRDFCTQPTRRAALGSTVFLFIPVYNVDGCENRQNTTRTNQVGPESFGFRGNGRNLDLNRDFVKCDSLAAQAFNQFFTAWSPDVMVDTHTSNGADYTYTMTLIATQADKLGGGVGAFFRDQMLPVLERKMTALGWPMCPYVESIKETPDDGLEEYLDSPRFSTGYAALHHTIGMMPETHMLKPFADRYASTRALVETVLAYTVEHGAEIRQLRNAAKEAAATTTTWPITWKRDDSRHTMIRFRGYRAVKSPSALGDYQRLSYDRSQPWEKDIPYFNQFVEDDVVEAPHAYLIPQAWREVIARLQWNGVVMQRLASDQQLSVQAYRFGAVTNRSNAYEGHIFHDDVAVTRSTEVIDARAGDWVISLQQPNARYAVETLEPLAHDSFFRWGMFDSVLEQKEHYSDYVFEDFAVDMLRNEPALQAKFEAWKQEFPSKIGDKNAVLDFLFAHGQACREPSWRRYPVFGLRAMPSVR